MKLAIGLFFGLLILNPRQGQAILVKKFLIRDTNSIVNNHPAYCNPRFQNLNIQTRQDRTHWVDFGKLVLNSTKKTISFRPTVAETYCTYQKQTISSMLHEYSDLIVGAKTPRVFQVGLFLINGDYRRALKMIKGKQNFSYYMEKDSVMNPKKNKFKRITFDASSVLDGMKEGDEVILAIDYAVTAPVIPSTRRTPFASTDEELLYKTSRQMKQEDGHAPELAESGRVQYDHYTYLTDPRFFKLAKLYLKRKVNKDVKVNLQNGPRFTFAVRKLNRGYLVHKENWYNKKPQLTPDVATTRKPLPPRRHNQEN